MIRYLNIKNYREYFSALQIRLNISDKKEDEMFKLIEDCYNSIEDDLIALSKCIYLIETSTQFNFTEKLYMGMLLTLCDIKCQVERKNVSNRFFKNRFGDDEEIETIDGDEDE